jgi:hypothetical protein
MKSSIYGVTQHDAPDSMIACAIYFVHAFIAIRIAILSSSLICRVDLFCRGKSLSSSDAMSC